MCYRPLYPLEGHVEKGFWGGGHVMLCYERGFRLIKPGPCVGSHFTYVIKW